MGHGITESDKVLSVRVPTWHQLELFREDYITLEEVRKLVHDWDVEREPVYRKRAWVDEEWGQLHEVYELVMDQEFNVRSDTDEILSTVPTERGDISIEEMYDLIEVIQGEDKNVLVETAGSLHGGRDVWVMIKLNEPIEIKGDPNGTLVPYFCAQNSYKPGMAFRGQAIGLRVVCANTSAAADFEAEASGMQFAFPHVSTIHERVELAKQALAGWRDEILAWKLAKEYMVTQPVTKQGVNWFVDQFIPAPHVANTTERVKKNIEVSRLELLGELFSPRTAGIEYTSLGLFEAASSWSEHIRQAQSPQSRFKRAVLSRSDILRSARELALEAVNV